MNLLSFIRKHVTRSSINAAFTAYCFLLPPILGSAVSVTFNGGGIWSIVELAISRRKFFMPRAVVIQTVVIYAYCASYLLSSAVNGSFLNDSPKLLSLATFLFFPLSYATWSISEKSLLARIVILASMTSCFGAFAMASGQYYWLGMRAEGGAGNAIVFATVVSLAVMICLAGRLSSIAGTKIPVMLAALAGCIAILLSGARIIWVAAPVAGLATLLIYRKNLSFVASRKLFLTVGAVAVIAAIVSFPVVAARFNAALGDISGMTAKDNYNTALGLRVALWQIGVEAFKQAPIFGHGAGATETLIKEGLQAGYGLDRNFNHFHNGFLTALVESGIVGAISLASIFIVAIANAAGALRTQTGVLERFGATMIVLVVTTYLIAGLTGILVGHDILDAVLMIFLIVGSYLAIGTMAAPPSQSPSNSGLSKK